MLSNEKTAEVCWGAIRTLMGVMGMPQPAWHRLAGWQLDLLSELVQHVRMGATPEQVHEVWSEGVTEHGKLRYGEWDPIARTHPWLRPWHEMSERDRIVFRLQNQMVMFISLESLIDDDAAPHRASTGDLPVWAQDQMRRDATSPSRSDWA
jgi:hypothetical protein